MHASEETHHPGRNLASNAAQLRPARFLCRMHACSSSPARCRTGNGKETRMYTYIAIAAAFVIYGVAARLFNDAACSSIQQSNMAFQELSWLLAACFL